MDIPESLRSQLQEFKDMLDPRKRKLKNIRDLVKQDPTYIKDLLGVVEDGLDDFKQQCTTDRNHLAQQALTNALGLLLDYKKIDKIKTQAGKTKFCVWIIDTILYCYPNGYPSNGSLNDKHLVSTFCMFYFDDPTVTVHDSTWEKETKCCHEYMCKLKEQWESIKSK